MLWWYSQQCDSRSQHRLAFLGVSASCPSVTADPNIVSHFSESLPLALPVLDEDEDSKAL